MQFRQLSHVLRREPGAYLGWLLARLGGLLIAYCASLTVYLFHGHLGSYLPGPESYLITGTISLALAGGSYLSLSLGTATSFSPILSISWAFLLAFVYGALIAMGVKTRVIGNYAISLVSG